MLRHLKNFFYHSKISSKFKDFLNKNRKILYFSYEVLKISLILILIYKSFQGIYDFLQDLEDTLRAQAELIQQLQAENARLKKQLFDLHFELSKVKNKANDAKFYADFYGCLGFLAVQFLVYLIG